MKLARVQRGGIVQLVRIEDDLAFPLVIEASEPWVDSLRVWLENNRNDAIGDPFPLASSSVLSAVKAPQKIIGVGLNYKEHAAEQNKILPINPMFFTKSPGAIIGPENTIIFSTNDSSSVDYEAELAVIIGKRTRHISVDDALESVLGYTICNDISARDIQASDGQFFRAKSFDTFCPIGPIIVTTDDIQDPQSLNIRTKINGDLRQNGNTSDMIFSVKEVVSYASRFMTLEPGDVITTGTPSGVGIGMTPPTMLKDGDLIEIEIENIGQLRNSVATT